MVVMVVGGDGRPLPGSLCIPQLGKKAVPLEMVSLLKTTEVAQRRVNIQQLSWLRADLSALDAWPCEDQRHPCSIVPEGVLPGDELLSNMPAVIRPEHDDGVLVEAVALQSIKDTSYLAVDEAGRCEVGPHQVLSLIHI